MDKKPFAPVMWPQSMQHAGYSIPYQAVCAVSIQASEAMLNAEAVTIFILHSHIICINKGAFR